jgi:hypothetical protein
VIRNGEEERTITVKVKRFTCRECKRLCNANEPFYPGTRIGSLVVDLFYTFSETMPASRAARLIDAMGIRVDRTSWKNYTGRTMPEIPAMDIFGMRLPSSVLTLSNIAARVPLQNRVDGAEALAACGYPSRFCPEVERVPVTVEEELAEDPAGPTVPAGLQAESVKAQAGTGSS